MELKLLEEDFFELINIGMTLAQEYEKDKLLDMIVDEARRFTHCDAGSLYIKEGITLKFVVAQNDTLANRNGLEAAKESFRPFVLPIDITSIAGYVATTGKPLIIDDVYNLNSNTNYKFNKNFDERNNYRTKSMLVLPLMDKNEILGVLQLINTLDEKNNVIPFDPKFIRNVQCLAYQASVAIKNANRNLELKKSQFNTLLHLSLAGEYRENKDGKHVKRIFTISEIISRNLGLTDEEIETIRYASVMHDIGKIAIPDKILLKTEKLTADERKIIQTHTVVGAEILNDPSSSIMTSAREVALTHHEKFDGTGYPKGLKGKEIPLSGRIVAVADVFDALTTEHCYKPAYTLEKSIAILKEEKGKHFDPEILDAFIKGMDIIFEMCEEKT